MGLLISWPILTLASLPPTETWSSFCILDFHQEKNGYTLFPSSPPSVVLFPIWEWSALHHLELIRSVIVVPPDSSSPLSSAMPFRERVRRVFHRPSSSSSAEDKPKVQYYRRHEVPPSKFRGPFDKSHQKSLASWSFEGACVERSRSLDDLALSPCATNNLSDCYDGSDSGEAECSLDEIADSG